MEISRATEAFLKSLIATVCSEIGDKTFFIAAILAMKNSRLTVFSGAAGALVIMTVLSAALGWAAPNLISKVYTHYAATALFFFFGLKSLYDFFTFRPEDELSEVEQELAAADSKSAGKKSRGLAAMLGMIFSPVFLKAFSLTFVGEWGDRSQITTIGLAASSDPFGVGLGGILGHALCTGGAVLGGRHLAQHINERLVILSGGMLFLLFGVHSLLTPP